MIENVIDAIDYATHHTTQKVEDGNSIFNQYEKAFFKKHHDLYISDINKYDKQMYKTFERYININKKALKENYNL